MLTQQKMRDESMLKSRELQRGYVKNMIDAASIIGFAESVRDEYLRSAQSADTAEWRERFVCYANVADTIVEFGRGLNGR